MPPPHPLPPIFTWNGVNNPPPWPFGPTPSWAAPATIPYMPFTAAAAFAAAANPAAANTNSNNNSNTQITSNPSSGLDLSSIVDLDELADALIQAARYHKKSNDNPFMRDVRRTAEHILGLDRGVLGRSKAWKMKCRELVRGRGVSTDPDLVKRGEGNGRG